MVLTLTLLICAIIYVPRLILHMTPGWLVLVFVGLMWAWPHMTPWMQSLVGAGIGGTIGLLLGGLMIAIPLRLFLGVPIREGTIGCVVIAIGYYAVTTVGKVWHIITSAVGAAVGGIPTYHWVIAACALVGVILAECWKAWQRAHPPQADDDDDDFDDDPTDSRPVLRLASLRAPSRADRKAAAIYAEIERKNKLSDAWAAWEAGRGPRPF